jgi:hypothetical protein
MYALSWDCLHRLTSSLSQVWFLWDLWSDFIVSNLRLLNLEGQVPVFISPRHWVLALYSLLSSSIFQPKVSWPVCLGVRPSLGAHNQIFPFLFFTLTAAWFLKWVPSLMRGRVCSLQCSHSRFWVLQDPQPTLMSPPRLPQPEGPGFRIYIPKEQGGPVIPPGTGFPFCCLLWLTGLPWLDNSVSLIREQTIPTERLPLVSEVSANFYG